MSRSPKSARDVLASCFSCNTSLKDTEEIRYFCPKCERERIDGADIQADGGAIASSPDTAEPAALSATAESVDSAKPVEGPLLPADSDLQPDVSYVFPTMDEEEGIGLAIDWAVESLKKLGLTGEIIVSDSSTDRTPEIAREKGAIVVKPNRLGYGYAYRFGFQYARGDYIVMGDPDCTYDFTELPKFLDQIENGDADLVLGSRFEGGMEPGAMPPLHKYVGNPLLTKFLNVFYDAGVTDAHSGFRVFTRDVLLKLDLHSDGMEFASEMVMDATEKGLSIDEVPIRYRKRKGEETLDSFHDGWRHVKFMLTHAPGYLFALPGAVLVGIGLILMSLSFFDIQPGPIMFGTHTMILGSLSVIVGFNVWELAIFSTLAANPIRGANDPLTRWVSSSFRLEHGVTLGLGLFAVGTVYGLYIIGIWVGSGFTKVPFAPMDMVAFTAIVIGIQMVFTSFHLSAIAE